MAFLSLALLLLLLQQPGECSQQKTSVEVGVLFELEQDPNTAAGGLLAIHLALDCIRTGSTRHCPVCESLRDSPVHLQLIQADAGRNKNNAEDKALQLVNTYENLTGFIGPLYSTNCEGVANVLRPHALSLISPSATNVRLEQKMNFFRTAPSDAVVCRAIMELVAVHLKYPSFVGVMEVTGGGVSEGVNHGIQELITQYDVTYQLVIYSGLQVDSAMEERLKSIDPAVILAIGNNAENTFNLHKRLYELQATRQLTYRVLLGGDILLLPAPQILNNTAYFTGVVSFRSSGSGDRYKLFEDDWPSLVRSLDTETVLRTVDGKQHSMDPDLLNGPSTYAAESFEALILYAKAAKIMLEKENKITMGDAMILLSNEPPWYCLDQDPVKLIDRTRERTRVAIFRHTETAPGKSTPRVVGNWTPSALRITAGALDDLVNPVASTSLPQSETNSPTSQGPDTTEGGEGGDPLMPIWAYGAIAALGVLLIFTCILSAVCCCCRECLPQCLRRNGRQDPQPLPGPVPGSASQPSPRRPADPPRPGSKHQGCRAIAILGGGPEAILCAIVEAHMALTGTNGNEEPTQVRLFTNEVRLGSNGLEYVDDARPWHVEMLHDSAKELLATVMRAWTPAGLEPCWSAEPAESAEESVCVWPKTRNVLDTNVEKDLLGVLNRMLHEQNRRVNEQGDGALKFRLEKEDYPKFQDLGARPSATAAELWQRWSQHFFHPDVADAVVVTGEACCLGLAGKDRDKPESADGRALYFEYALRIFVHADEDHEQRQKYNAFLSLCSCRVFYNYEPQSRRGTLIMRITEAERKSLQLPANPNAVGDCLGSDYSSVDVIWPTVPARSFDTLQSILGILSSYIKDYLYLFNLLPELVRRIECVRWAPAFMPNQVFLKGLRKTPVVLLSRSAYVSDVLGRSFSCKIKGAVMAPIALRLFHNSKKQETTLAKLENFLKLDRDDEMRFAKSMKACLPGYLDDVVTASGPEPDRFSNQAAALQQEIDAAEFTAKERDELREKSVTVLAERCHQWQRLTNWGARGQQDIQVELTSFERGLDSPFRRQTVTLEALYALEHAFRETKPSRGQVSGTKGLPRDFLRDDANTDVGVQNLFGIDPFGVHPAPAAAG